MEGGDHNKDTTSQPPPHSAPGGNSEHDLMGSAKVVTDAAKSVYTHHNMEGIDKERVQAAAMDIYGAAKGYMGSSETTHQSAPPAEGRREEEHSKSSEGGGVGEYVNVAKGLSGFFK